MSLRYALLAVLTVEPMTGYDLSKLFQQSVSHVWNAPDSQIYPELKRMEKDHLVVGKEVPWGPKGRKRQYTISPEGLQAFKQWMNEPVAYSPERDPAHLKAAYLEWATPEGARMILEAHREHFENKLSDWKLKHQEIESISNDLLSKRLNAFPTSQHKQIIAFKLFTYEGLIQRAQHEIAWARQGIQLLGSFSHNKNVILPKS